MKRMTFYKCGECGTIAMKAVDGGGEMCCCKKPMTVLEPNTTDAAQEKHVPVATVNGDAITVNVGSVDHPMTEEHQIEWVYVVTEEGAIMKCLNAGEAPHAVIELGGQKPLAVFEHCNLHGLWKTEL